MTCPSNRNQSRVATCGVYPDQQSSLINRSQHIHHFPRSQPASGLRRQPELCQQAVIAVFQFSVSQNPADGDLCRGGGNVMCQCVAFRITNR